IGTTAAGRTDLALDDLVGFFVNTLVLRTDLTGDPTFREVLTRVRDTAWAAFDNQDVPFERLVEMLYPRRAVARAPLFQVLFEVDDVPTGQAPAEVGTAKFDREFTVGETFDADHAAAGLRGNLIAAADLFDVPTAESIAARWTRALATLSEAPDLSLG